LVKKTAERIIVELRDKVSEFVSGAVASGMVVERIESVPMEDAAAALVALGFSHRDAEKALAQVDITRIASVDSGGIVREALRFI
jgi:holliday junction DNA helicase RuvA